MPNDANCSLAEGVPKTGMVADAQATVRNASLLVVQWGAQVASGFVFAALVPRLMGPEVYGRYALITSLSLWFVAASTLGLQSVMSRYVWEFAGDNNALRVFFGRLLTLRLGSGALAAGLYGIVTAFWFRDLDPVALALVAGAVLVQAVSGLFYGLFLGLNRAALWGLGQALRGWVIVALLVPGYLLGGLRGACVGLIVAEVVVLCLGVGWARAHVALPAPRADVWRAAPYLRFGLIFFGSTLLLTAYQRSGDALVSTVSGNYVQVGFFGLAYSVYSTANLALTQVTSSFAPLLTSLLIQGQSVAVRAWVERLLKGLAVVGVMAVFGVLLLGDDLVPIVFGEAYRPVSANLVPLTATLLVLVLTRVGRLLTLVCERPGVALAAAGVQFVSFWTLGPPLVAWQGSLGGCLAVLGASCLTATYLTSRMGRRVRYSLKGWALAIALGCVFLPLIGLRSAWGVNAALYCAFVVGYIGVLRWSGVLTRGELAAVFRTFRQGVQGGKAADSNGWS